MITEAKWRVCDMCKKDRVDGCKCYHYTLLVIPDLNRWNSEKWDKIVVPHYRRYRAAGVITVSASSKSIYSQVLRAKYIRGE